MKTHGVWIGGKERRTGATDVVRSPWDGSDVGLVSRAGAAEVEEAIAAAHAAFPAMRALPTHARAAILERTAAVVRERADELAHLMARESGKPIRYCRGEVARAVVTFTLGAGEARRFGGEVLPIDLEPRAEGRLCLYTRVPRGPVGAISPFNFPLNLVAHKLAPAIAVGTTVVLKPPPQCPLTALELTAILHEAGLPDGALDVVHCAPEDAQRLAEDERIKVLSFTGSDTVGWKLKALAGKKQVLLELGGNAPCIVDEGVDLDGALDPLLTAAWAHAGQVCIKAQRVLVHASLYAEFLERFVERTRALRCGDPLDEETVVGPLIEERHVERVLEWLREAADAGATLHCGGERRGQVVTPAVLTGARDDLRVCKDEVFGPVTVVEPFDDFGAALARCNATRFGLQAGVFTPRVDHALRAFRVDNFPYGGTKDSGLGREGVRYAMEDLSEPKVLVLG